MSTIVKLTDTQREVLKVATQRPDGNLEPLPANLRGGARAKVIAGLLARDLITKAHHEHYATDAGYAAVGRKRRAPADAVTKRDATEGVQNLDTIPRPVRPGTKLAAVVDAMRRRGGATIAQMMADTGWQAHTVRGAISGMIRRKLGYNVVAEKDTGGERVYRIT